MQLAAKISVRGFFLGQRYTNADVVVLAGDIGVGMEGIIEKFQPELWIHGHPQVGREEPRKGLLVLTWRFNRVT